MARAPSWQPTLCGWRSPAAVAIAGVAIAAIATAAIATLAVLYPLFVAIESRCRAARPERSTLSPCRSFEPKHLSVIAIERMNHA